MNDSRDRTGTSETPLTGQTVRGFLGEMKVKQIIPAPSDAYLVYEVFEGVIQELDYLPTIEKVVGLALIEDNAGEFHFQPFGDDQSPIEYFSGEDQYTYCVGIHDLHAAIVKYHAAAWKKREVILREELRPAFG